MLLELLKKRRSIRKYQDKKIEQKKINTILQAGLLSPSGKSKRPWEFLVVDDSEKLEKLSHAKAHGSELIKEAPVAIVMIGDEKTSDTWVEDCSIALTIMQLEAEEMGLGSCWVQLDKRKSAEDKSSDSVAREILGIEGDKKVLAVLALGYPLEKKKGYSEEDIDFSKVYYNTYGSDYKKKQ